MGTLYASQSAAGYNASPPPDDGSQGSNNQITWGTTIKGKIGDPLKALADAINSQLTTTLDLSPRAISTPDSAVASDHWRTLQVTGTTTITLSDAATMTNKYVVGIANMGAGVVTVSRATGANTINGTAANFTIPIGAAVVLGVNQAANGYNIISSTGGNSNNTSLVATTSVTTPVVDSGSTGSLSLKTNNGTQQVTITHVAPTVNFINIQGAGTGISPGLNSVGETNAGLNISTSGTGTLGFYSGGFANPALQLLGGVSTRNVTIAGSNGGNPTISTTGGSLAITPAVVIAGTSLNVGSGASDFIALGSTPSTAGAGLRLMSLCYITARSAGGGANVTLLGSQTINSVQDICVLGATETGGTASAGVVGFARSKAGAPTTSDIPAGMWSIWRDTSGATTKLYYNNAGSIQSVALA